MRKIVIVLLLGVLLLVGCSQTSDTLKVGMDLRFYPFTGMDSEGNPSGIEIDIAEALGKYLGKNVEFVNTEFPMLIPALQTEEIDIIIGSMSVTEEREKTVDFSNPYYFDKIIALINKEFAEEHKITDKMPIEDFFALNDARYIGITGSIAVSIPQSYGFEVTNVTSDAVAEREIATGNADVLVGAYTLFGMHHKNPEDTILYKNAIESSSIGMAVKEGNKELLDQVNAFIAQMESSGLNDELRRDWNEEVSKKLFDKTITLDYYLQLKEN